MPVLPAGFVGVDVFFVISGFLITTQLVNESAATGKISLVRFYARRAKRLFPAVAVVLVATGMLTWRFVPETRWHAIGGDIVGASLYVANWRFANEAVDYLADSRPSPVQHFWSLAVEEQFYVVWPLMVMAVLALHRRRRGEAGPPFAWGLGLVVVPSFLWSLHRTETLPARAFFETTTRMWELGIGAAVALAAVTLAQLTRKAAAVLAAGGLVAVFASALAFDEGTAWPGSAAALPTLGTAAVIAAGFRPGGTLVGRALAVAPMRWVGGLSYSLYLWHWPLLVVAAIYFDGLSTWAGLAIVVASFGPAWVTWRLVENPIRFSRTISARPIVGLTVGSGFTAVGLASGLMLIQLVAALPVESGTTRALGAAVLREDPRGDPNGAVVDDVDWITPIPAKAVGDDPGISRCETPVPDTQVRTCTFGDRNGDVTVAVVGDSKVSQWMSALIPIAEQSGWRLRTFVKYSCPFALAEQKNYGAVCQTWVRDVLERLEANPPDFVITSQSEPMGRTSDGDFTREAMQEGLRQIWERLRSHGVQVIAIANNPYPGQEVYECVAEHRHELSKCAFDRDEAVRSSVVAQQRAAAAEVDGAKLIDLNDAICPTPRCPAVIGNVLIYRTGSHLTATYVNSMAPRLARALSRAGLPVPDDVEAGR